MIKPKSGKSTLLSLLGCFIVLAALFVSACTKDDTPTGANRGSNAPVTPPATIVLDYTSLWNANNPYDSTGYWHNGIIAYIGENKSLISASNFPNTCGALVTSYLTLNNISTSDMSATISDFAALTLADTSNFYYAQNRSINARKAFAKFWLIVLNYQASAETNITALISKIKAQENSLAGIQMPSSEKESLYRMMSVMKFSTLYWYNERINIGTSNWRTELEAKGTPSNMIAATDAAGSDARGAHTANYHSKDAGSLATAGFFCTTNALFLNINKELLKIKLTLEAQG